MGTRDPTLGSLARRVLKARYLLQLAWELGRKGITVYRAGTRHGRVLSLAGPESR